MLPRRDPEENETQVLHDLVDFTHKRVVEIGCGDGRLTRRYAASTGFVAALDTDLSRLTDAIAHPTPNHANYLQSQAEDLPFRSEHFDIAILAWSL